MGDAMDVTFWQNRLDELARQHNVPGASLAILHNGEVTALATGVLNVDTGVETTTDSLFQIGSITKVYTATVVLRLLADTSYTVDTPVVEILPDFKVADPDVTKQVTLRHLLSHSSGIDGDLFLETGRGDDCIEKYVAACADLKQNHPLGATMSYCNSGFTVLGRVIEKLTGKVWDEALREQLIEPLGLTHTVTLPEEVLRFRAAMGHIHEGDEPPKTAPMWGLMRSAGPAGLINARASDVVEFARLHLDGGRDVLSAGTAAAMLEPQIRIPDPWTLARQWGLGWILFNWDNRTVYGHDGNTIGQSGFLRVVPDANLAVSLLVNGGHTRALYQDLYSELMRELADLTMPELPTPPENPPDLEAARFTGVYERVSARITVREADGGRLTVLMESTGALADLHPAREISLVPFTKMGDDGDAAFVGQLPGEPLWMPAVFYRLPTGERYLHFGARATPRVADL